LRFARCSILNISVKMLVAPTSNNRFCGHIRPNFDKK
jgi:hypothetical protein